MELVFRFFDFPAKFFGHGAEFFRSFGAHIKDHFVPHHRNNYHPHIFSHSMTMLLSVLMISVKIFSIAVVSFGPVLPAYSSAITVENIINLTNQSRKEYNLKTLVENSTLNQAAQAKANDMLLKGYFSHNTPDGKTPWDFIQTAGYGYIMAGENLAVNFTEAEHVEEAWMNSPGHKANIINKDFEEIGIGIAQGDYQGHNAIFVVQMFGTPVEQKIQLSDRATEVAPEPVSAPNKTISINEEKTLKSNSENQPLREAPAQLSDTAPTPLLEVIKEPLAVLEITEAKTEAVGNVFNVFTQTSPNAVKVILHYGQMSVLMEPKENNTWQASLDLNRLASNNYHLRITAYNLQGEFVSKQVASFSGSTVENFNILGVKAGSKEVSWMGKVFNPKIFENQFYLLFVAAVLTSLIIAILVHRHIQHVSVTANASFMAILAILLWLGS